MVGKRRAGIIIFLLIFFALGLPRAWCENAQPKVAVLPFKIQGGVNAAKTQMSLDQLFSRLGTRAGLEVIEPALVEKVAGGPVSSQARARSIGNKLGASYVLFGTCKQAGNTIAIQATLVDMSGAKKPVLLLAEQQGLENLASAVEKIVDQTSADVSGKAIIAAVRVKGNVRIESAAIKDVVKSKKGQVFNPEQVSNDIRAIFGMGYFENVAAEVKNTPAGKILTFIVKENPIVSKLVIKGNKKIKKKDILAAIVTKQYSVLRRSDIVNDMQKIRKLYQQKGYYNAKIAYQITFPVSKREAVVTFNIKEHKRVYIKSIKFVGNKHISSRTLADEMETRPWSLLSYISERGILQRSILATDIERLNGFYHNEGYMDAVVGSPTITLKEDGFHITIPVHEGTRYKISSVTISGGIVKGYKKKIENKLQTKPKNYFNGTKIRNDMDMIKGMYMNLGYAKVEVNPLVKRNPETHTVDVNLHIKKFGIVRIGRIYITGNTKTRDYVIRRTMKIAEGAVFNAQAIKASLYALRRLDYFKNVQIIPVATSKPDVMDLNVKIVEKKTGTLSFGGGYSTQDGLFVTGQVQQKNLEGTGQYLGVQALVAQDAQYYMISYTKPWIFNTRFSGGVDVYDWLRAYEDFACSSYGIKLRAGYPLGRYSNLTAYYVVENAEIQDLDAAASLDPVFIHAQSLGWQLKSGVGVAFVRNTTDRPFLPTRGTYIGLAFEYDSKDLGGSYNLFKQEYHFGYYHPLFWKFIGHVRVEAGFENGSSYIPIYNRFFLGGIDSMRGWKFNYLGPEDAHGLVIGGNKYMVINTELLFPLLEHYGVRGVLFFDYGNVFPAGEDINFGDFKEDVGPGIRWNSPFGPLRIEMGYVLNRKHGDPTYEWQFSAGAFF